MCLTSFELYLQCIVGSFSVPLGQQGNPNFRQTLRLSTIYFQFLLCTCCQVLSEVEDMNIPLHSLSLFFLFLFFILSHLDFPLEYVSQGQRLSHHDIPLMRPDLCFLFSLLRFLTLLFFSCGLFGCSVTPSSPPSQHFQYSAQDMSFCKQCSLK